MSTVSTTPTRSTVILEKPSDWDEWIFIVEQKAKSANIWNLVNPDLATEPAQPREPSEPTPATVKPGATSIVGFSAEERDTYKLLFAGHKTQLAKYEKQRIALQDIQNHILSTLSRNNLSFIMDKETVYAKLTALKKRLAPTDRARKLELSQKYQALKKAPRQGPLDKWLQQWEKVYTDAKKLELPEVQDDRPLYDFLLAIKFLEPNFAGIHEVLITQKSKESTALPTLFDLIEDFRNHRRLAQAASSAKPSPSHSAFATFQGDSDNSKKERKCLCGEMHQFKRCPYLVEHLRATNWEPDPQVSKQIEDALQRSPKLRGMIKRAQKHADEDKSNAD